MDDVLNLARANILNYSLALDTIQYLEKETHYLPWLAAYNNFGFIVNRFTSKDSPVIKVGTHSSLEHAHDITGLVTACRHELCCKLWPRLCGRSRRAFNFDNIFWVSWYQ